jgi:hypothetical protein
MAAMADINMVKNCSTEDPTRPNTQADVKVQLVLSLALGISAFVGFCVSVTSDEIELCDKY